MKKLTAVLLALALVIGFVDPQIVIANEAYTTDAMCSSDYWKERTITDAEEVLMTTEEVVKVNQAAIAGKGTYVNDLMAYADTYNASKLKQSLLNSLGTAPNKAHLYVDGVEIDKESYFQSIADAFEDSAYTGTMQTQYAVAVAYADLCVYPMDGYLGYSAADTDNENVNSAIMVNEPVVIRQKCINEGKTYYLCYSTNCSGWVDAEKLAVCSSKEEWVEAWKVDMDGEDFLVVTQDKICLEPSYYTPQIANVKLTLGTILKLVAKEDIPKNIGERGTWNNYVVYLPTRNEDGTYKREVALISQHYDVSIGFLPVTQANILDIAFSCLGNRYGWGGMLESFDCSLYTRTIYRCFGFELPRNTTWQQLVPNTKIDIRAMTDEQKVQFIETLPAGALLYFTGHTMMYVGSENGKNYAISATGSLSDSIGDTDVCSMYSVIVNSLMVRRKNRSTWLNNLSSVVLVMPKTDLSSCTITAKKASAKADDTTAEVTVSLGGKVLYKDLNYTYEIKDGKVKLQGINNLTGTAEVPITYHVHSYTSKITKQATCTQKGTKTFTCSCGDTYTESIPVKAHNSKITSTVKTTNSENGLIVKSCSVCGAVVSRTVISRQQKVELSTSKYVYDGKVKTPKVTVKDAKGKVISSSNYTVTYATGRKQVGSYKVTIRFKGNYSGTMTKTFTIVPQTTKISSLSAGKSTIQVKWNKNTQQTTGYQIQYATNAAFTKNVKTITVKKNSTVSTVMAGMKSKTKYYVRIRTYKTISKTNYFSSWSSVKTVTTKK